MHRLRHRDPASVYLLMRGASELFFAIIVIVNVVYQVEVAHLDPLGLLLVGSVLELTCLVLQVPTGLLADTYSRKLAVVAGTVLVGAGFMLEGLVPNFWSILLAQVIWGAGASLADGAEDAWITEEVGTSRASGLFLRGSQAGQLGGLAGVVAGVALATVRLNLPIVLGGLLTLVLGIALFFLMREEKFGPAPRHEKGDLAGMLVKGGETLAVVRAKPVLLSILLVTAIAGASSEGFDRLFQVHLLKDVGLPHLAGVNPLYWFGLLSFGSVILGLGVTELARRRLDLQKHQVAVRALLFFTTILGSAIIAFAFAPNFPAAAVAYWVARNAARVWDPVQRAWLNQSLEPATRATLFSVDGQANALGQIASGPVLGLLARMSIPTALAVSGALLLPALAVFYRESRRTLLFAPVGTVEGAALTQPKGTGIRTIWEYFQHGKRRFRRDPRRRRRWLGEGVLGSCKPRREARRGEELAVDHRGQRADQDGPHRAKRTVHGTPRPRGGRAPGGRGGRIVPSRLSGEGRGGP